MFTHNDNGENMNNCDQYLSQTSMFGKLVQTNYHTIFVITKVSFNYHCHYHPIGINDIGRHIIVTI